MQRNIKEIRNRKMRTQKGLCYYCEQPMWTGCVDEFCVSLNIPRKKASLFQCTAEHLLANQNGGLVSENNIVAACRYCNATRHKALQPLGPIEYKSKVLKRIRAGRWLTI